MPATPGRSVCTSSASSLCGMPSPSLTVVSVHQSPLALVIAAPLTACVCSTGPLLQPRPLLQAAGPPPSCLDLRAVIVSVMKQASQQAPHQLAVHLWYHVLLECMACMMAPYRASLPAGPPAAGPLPLLWLLLVDCRDRSGGGGLRSGSCSLSRRGSRVRAGAAGAKGATSRPAS